MGRSFWFQCPKCEYQAKVSGGEDRGLDLFVQTISCPDCRGLYDAVTRVRVAEDQTRQRWRGAFGLNGPGSFRRSVDPKHPPSFSAVLNRLPYRGTPRFRWVLFNLQCPVSKTHRVRAWNDPDRCPRCGTLMEKNALPFRIWE